MHFIEVRSRRITLSFLIEITSPKSNRIYPVLFPIQLGKGIAGCGDKRLFNRESPRINANRIFLAPACSAPADRLRRNRTPSGKMLRKNRRAGFSLRNLLILYNRKIMKQQKNPHAGFSSAFFKRGCDSCVGDQPEQSTRT